MQTDMAANPGHYTPPYVKAINDQLNQFNNAESFFNNSYFVNNGALLFTQFGSIPPANTSPPTPNGFLVYSVLLNQTGTAAPVPTILANTVGALVWSRNSGGNYSVKLTGAFVANKTFVSLAQPGVFSALAQASCFQIISTGEITVFTDIFAADTITGDITGTPHDAYLINTPFEIRVYN